MNGTAYTAPGHGATVRELVLVLAAAFLRESDIERGERIAVVHYSLKAEAWSARTNLVLLGRALTDADLDRIAKVDVARVA